MSRRILIQKGPILIVDDDDEDLHIIEQAYNTLGFPNEILLFQEVNKFLEYLKTKDIKPFFILCDVNITAITGYELRELIHKDPALRLKSVPFLFLSTSNALEGINKAYSLSVQGYFQKPDSFKGIINMLQDIIYYWDTSLHPILTE